MTEDEQYRIIGKHAVDLSEAKMSLEESLTLDYFLAFDKQCGCRFD